MEKARQGIYSPYAFRRRAYREDDKYFSLVVPASGSAGGLEIYDGDDAIADKPKKPVRYLLVDFVREKVRFSQGNIFDEKLLQGKLPYDIVFCRNMLIYFDRAARDRMFSFLDRMLKPNGLLFLGYAETGLVDTTRYQPVSYPQTFAFYKRSLELKRHSAVKMVETKSPSRNIQRRLVLPAIEAISSVASQRQMNRSGLDVARELADKGSIETAVELCDRCLVEHPASAAAYLLRGELYQAQADRVKAEACFERAIYLNPHSEAALTHLLLIQEGKGEADRAKTIRTRLQRLIYNS